MNENPYHTVPDDERSAPFAGRQNEILRLEHYLKDPAAEPALLFVGRRWLGKTSLLKCFSQILGDMTIAAYFPLDNVQPQQEADFWQALVSGVNYYLARLDITSARLPTPPEAPPNWRAWITDIWLPELTHLLRQRQLVLLLDDVQYWLIMPEVNEHLAFFQQLLVQQPNIRLVMTLSATHEEQLPLLSPLVNTANTQRLAHLTLSECAWLLQTPSSQQYAVPDDGVLAVYQATGGHPLLTQRFAHHLYEYSTTSIQPVISQEVVRSHLQAVYKQSHSELQHLWQEAPHNQRLVLMAISDLHYHDPLARINTETIAAWNAENGHVLDRAGINAALRSLEYRELISLHGERITLTIGLMQMWLVDNARRLLAQPSSTRQRRPLIVIAGVMLVVIVLLLILTLSNTPQENNSTPPAVPTVTLTND